MRRLYGAAGIKEISEKVGFDCRSHGASSQFVAVVFANANKKFVKEEILPLVKYWNYRSGDRSSVFFVGYPEFCGDATTEMMFDEAVFTSTVEECERHFSWAYEGDTPILLCCGRLLAEGDAADYGAYLDSSSYVVFPLESAVREKTIPSVEPFFELIFRVAKTMPPEHVTWKLSDTLWAGNFGGALLDAINDKLKGTKRLADSTRLFRVQSNSQSRQ